MRGVCSVVVAAADDDAAGRTRTKQDIEKRNEKSCIILTIQTVTYTLNTNTATHYKLRKMNDSTTSFYYKKGCTRLETTLQYRLHRQEKKHRGRAEQNVTQFPLRYPSRQEGGETSP